MDTYRLALDLRMVVAGVFLFAGASKLSHDSVRDQLKLLNAIGVPSKDLVRGAVRLLPVIEICLALWLLSTWLTVAALMVVAGHVLVFSIVLAKSLKGGYTGGCGCFGRSTRAVGLADVVFNFMLMVAVLATLSGELSHGNQARSVLDMRMSDVLIITVVAVCWLGTVTILAEMHELVRRTVRGADA